MARPEDRPSDGAADRVVTITCSSLTIVFIEVTVGVQRLVAEVIISTPMKLLCAILRDNIDVCASSLPVLRLIIRGHDTNFFDGVEIEGRIQC